MRNKQVAALPYCAGRSGPKILLITTRTKRKWLIPKGVAHEGPQAAKGRRHRGI
jgi:hypothetical protein